MLGGGKRGWKVGPTTPRIMKNSELRRRRCRPSNSSREGLEGVLFFGGVKQDGTMGGGTMRNAKSLESRNTSGSDWSTQPGAGAGGVGGSDERRG